MTAPVRAKTILIATGGHPAIPEFPGAEHLITSNDAFKLERLPESIIIVGAGYIGMEFASIFAGLGVKVTVIHRGEQILRDFDGDLRDGLAAAMRRHGIDIRVNTELERIDKEGEGFRVHFKRGDSLRAGLVMAAIGRLPNTMGLGLQHAGVELGWNGHVVVDEYSRSSVENIYAVGDVTDRVNLTPVAIHEATAFSETVFNDKPTPVDHTTIPTAVFSDPEIGTVGLSEEEAREKGPRHRHLQGELPADEIHASRPRGEDDDEARGRHGDPTRCLASTSSAPTRPRSFRSQRLPCGSGSPRRNSTPPCRCIRAPPRSS